MNIFVKSLIEWAKLTIAFFAIGFLLAAIIFLCLIGESFAESIWPDHGVKCLFVIILITVMFFVILLYNFWEESWKKNLWSRRKQD